MARLSDIAHAERPPWIITLAKSAAPIGCVFVIALLMQLILKPGLGDEGAFYAKIVLDCGISIMLAVSLTMVNGFTGQFSMGHAAFMAVGAYTAAGIMYYGTARMLHVENFGDAGAHAGLLSTMLNDRHASTPILTRSDVLFVFAALAGGLVSAMCGYLVGLPSLRLKGDYLAIVTLGFGEILRVLIQSQTTDVLYDVEEIRNTPWYMLPKYLGGPVGFSGLPFYTGLFWVFLACGLTLLVAFRLKRSSIGRAFLSIREDETAAEAMGVDTTRYKVRAFVLASFFAGVAGALYAHTVGVQLNAGELGFVKSFDIIIMVVLGGLGSISGAALAAIILTILPEALRDVAQYRMVVYALILILVMILRPQGLFGIHEVWDRAAWSRIGRLFGARSSGGRS